MKTDYSFLPEHKQRELKGIVTVLIPRFAEIEMIILFGSHARNTWVEDYYTENGTQYSYISDYDLLIILSKNAQANSHTLTQAITQRLRDMQLRVPAQPIYHGIEFVNQELSEGSYFFGDIKKEGILLFTTNRYQLAHKRDMSPAELQAKAQKEFDQWFESANGFYKTFEFNMREKEYKIAAFQLHQATERYYGAIQLVFTAYKPKTHNLEELGSLAKACNMEFSKAFPMASKQEQHRFDLLKRAYVDARYKDDYLITKQDLDYLAERVQVLRKLTEEICREKIKGFVG
jgi:HEPN domain-containing protein